MNDQFCFSRANEFFESLTSKNAGAGFVYRGHEDSKYELVPSFQRTGNRDNFSSLEDVGIISASTWPYRVFYQTANQMGLPLPTVSNAKHSNYTSESHIERILDYADEIECEYDADDLEIMAFAQHYQVPTSLLDWTRSPLVAMHFAASGALKVVVRKLLERVSIDQVRREIVSDSVREEINKYLEEQYLSVWQANSLALDEVSRQRRLFKTETDDTYSISFFTPRMQGNQNIVAQQGLFSIHAPTKMTFDYRYAEAPAKCLSAVVDEHIKWLDSRGSNSQFLETSRRDGMLKELKLPYSQIVRLLKLLGSCGIHAATVYPGHEGCAKRVKEKADISLIDRFLSSNH